jgi:hypothetical protein
LSSVLFNIFINDVAAGVKNLNHRIVIENERICILLYADNIVLLAENEAEIQNMFSFLNDWYIANGIFVNASKSNVVHFRPNSIHHSDYILDKFFI